MVLSLVLSPQSLSWAATLALSLAAVSYAVMTWFSDLMSRYNFREMSGCCRPRSVESPKRVLGAAFSVDVPFGSLFLDRVERDRFLGKLNERVVERDRGGDEL